MGNKIYMKGRPRPLGLEIECKKKGQMKDGQRNNDSQRGSGCEDSRPSTESVCVAEASLPGDTPSVGEDNEHMTATMEVLQHEGSEIGQYSVSDVLNSEGTPTVAGVEHGESSHDEFSDAKSEAAPDLIQTSIDIIAGVDALDGSVIQRELLNNFEETVRDYDRLNVDYAILRSILEHDSSVLEKLKRMLDDAKSNNDEGFLSVLVAEMREKFAEMRIRMSYIRDDYSVLHIDLCDLWSQIDHDLYEHRFLAY